MKVSIVGNMGLNGLQTNATLSFGMIVIKLQVLRNAIELELDR